MRTSAYYLVLTAFCLHSGLLMWRLGVFLRNISPRRRLVALGATGLILFIAILASGDIPVRGARANEHDFTAHSLDFFKAAWNARERKALFEEGEKEIAPLAWFSLADRAGGFSLRSLLISQKILWLLCAMLIFASLFISGFTWISAAFAALLFSLNFLSWICMQSFSTTLANLFFLISAICALAALIFERARALPNFAWFLCASFLVLSSRYEFLPILAAGFLFFVLTGGMSKLAGLGKRGAAASAIFLTASGIWLFVLAKLTAPNAEPMFKIFDSARYHLGQGNLGRLFGVPFEAFSWLPYLAMLACAALTRRLKNPGFLAFWAFFSCAAGLYFASILTLVGLFPLEYTRHHLYFFIPFIFLAAVLFEASLRLSAGKILPAAALLFLGIYFIRNVKRLEATQALLRTNDREWQFLLKARSAWPEGCAAAHPIEDARAALLRKYFPREGSCRLVYRSPYYQIFNLYKPVYENYPREAENFYGEPWVQEVFRHRFYTDWHIPVVGGKTEILSPIPVRVGFYRVSDWGSLNLNPTQGWPRRIKQEKPEEWFEIFNRPSGYLASLEICYKKAMSDEAELERDFFIPRRALECVEEALHQAPPQDKPALLASRANILEAMRAVPKD